MLCLYQLSYWFELWEREMQRCAFPLETAPTVNTAVYCLPLNLRSAVFESVYTLQPLLPGSVWARPVFAGLLCSFGSHLVSLTWGRWVIVERAEWKLGRVHAWPLKAFIHTKQGWKRKPYPSSRGQDNLLLTSWQRPYNFLYVWRESEGVPRPVRLTITINTHTQYTIGPYNV